MARKHSLQEKPQEACAPGVAPTLLKDEPASSTTVRTFTALGTDLVALCQKEKWFTRATSSSAGNGA